MLTLRLRFEDSWTNSFYRAGPDGSRDEPLYTSGSALGASTKGIKPVPLDLPALAASGSRVDYLRSLQAANPELLYRVPESYDRTVQGVLARLMGECRRLKDLPEDHLALRAYAHGRYRIRIEHEHSQLARLATYEVNDIQTGGAGVIVRAALYEANERTRALFSALSEPLATLEAALAATGKLTAGAWTPDSPATLIDRLALRDEEQVVAVKALAAARKAGEAVDACAFPHLTGWLMAQLPDHASATQVKTLEALARKQPDASLSTAEAVETAWSLAGATVVAAIAGMDEATRLSCIEAGLLTERGGLAGMSMTGGVGKVTPKDMYRFATGTKAVSNRMPYTVTVPVARGDKTDWLPSAVLKKTGVLEFELDDDTLAPLVKQAIEEAAVGPLAFGKKGVAYLADLQG